MTIGAMRGIKLNIIFPEDVSNDVRSSSSSVVWQALQGDTYRRTDEPEIRIKGSAFLE